MKKQRSSSFQNRVILFFIILFIFICFIYYLTLLDNIRTIDGIPSFICIGKLDPILNNISKKEFVNRQLFNVKIDVANIPHPNKVHTGGEDNFFISDDYYSFGVFDGVGGWNDLGIDPSDYSKSLAKTSKECVSEYNMRDPLSILCVAENKAKMILGSSTACCITIDKNILYAANLGDSGFLIFRDSKIVFQSQDLLHEFNFPYQIGAYGDGLDSTDEYEIEIFSGDVILVATDGLFDNLFLHEITELLNSETLYSSRASFIAESARIRSIDLIANSPHGEGARKVGYFHQGGKPDDITVLLAKIE